MGEMDVDIATLVKLKRFIEEQCNVGLWSIERVGALTHKHFQMVVKGDLASLLVLNKITKVCLGWDGMRVRQWVILPHTRIEG